MFGKKKDNKGLILIKLKKKSRNKNNIKFFIALLIFNLL